MTGELFWTILSMLAFLGVLIADVIINWDELKDEWKGGLDKK